MSPVRRSKNRFNTPQVINNFTEPLLTLVRVIPETSRSQRLMTFIVNPSHRLPVVRQIAAVKVLPTVLAIIAGGVDVRAQSAAATPVQQRLFELRIQRSQQLNQSRHPADGRTFFVKMSYLFRKSF
jgi:hypothetical protein